MSELLDIQRPLGRKYLKCFAGGIAHRFLCSCEHYAWMAYQRKIQTVYIDLMTLQISPHIFNIDRNMNLAKMCQDTLYYNIQRHGLQNKVTAAVLYANFGIDAYTKISGYSHIGKSCITVTLTDDRGKQWTVDRIEKSTLIQP